MHHNSDGSLTLIKKLGTVCDFFSPGMVPPNKALQSTASPQLSFSVRPFFQSIP